MEDLLGHGKVRGVSQVYDARGKEMGVFLVHFAEARDMRDFGMLCHLKIAFRGTRPGIICVDASDRDLEVDDPAARNTPFWERCVDQERPQDSGKWANLRMNYSG